MKIQKVIIENVANFKNRTEVSLSNYNVFIGKNGSGKSNLAKAIFLVANAITKQVIHTPTPFRGDFVKPSSIEIVIALEENDINEFVQSQSFLNIKQNPTFAQTVPLSSFPNQKKLTLRRSVSGAGQQEFKIIEFPVPSPGGQNLRNAYSSVYAALSGELNKKVVFVYDTRDLPPSFNFDSNFQSSQLSLNNFMTFFMNIKQNVRYRPLYDSILSLYRRIVPSIEDLIINPAGNIVSLGESGSSFEIPATNISKGTREILLLLTILTLAREGSVVFIEEPEIHLHPAAANELGVIIRELIEENNIQVILTTHSPEFLVLINPEDQDNKVIKFVRDAGGSSSIHSVENLSDLSDAMEELERKEKNK